MPTSETEKERRKSTTDAHKNHHKKDARRKSTVAKLWNWISTKKDDGHNSKDDSDIKHKKHRAVKKTGRSYTAAVDGRYDYSDASDDSDIHPGPPPLRRHVSAHPAAPLTPPDTPDLDERSNEEDELHPKAIEAANDETLQTERKLSNLEPKPKPKTPTRESQGSKGRSSGSGARPKQQQAMMKPRGSPKTDSGNRRRRKRRSRPSRNMDPNQPLEYPCTPELILDHHKRKEFLTQNEEWLVVELNEYECLIESIEMIHRMAKFSKMFEMDPPEFLEEFFEFVDEVPSYDEVINTDVWQEFRDVKYPY